MNGYESAAKLRREVDSWSGLYGPHYRVAEVLGLSDTQLSNAMTQRTETAQSCLHLIDAHRHDRLPAYLEMLRHVHGELLAAGAISRAGQWTATEPLTVAIYLPLSLAWTIGLAMRELVGLDAQGLNDIWRARGWPPPSHWTW